MQTVLHTVVGHKTNVSIEATCWTPKEIGRLIHILTIMKGWLEEDQRNSAATPADECATAAASEIDTCTVTS